MQSNRKVKATGKAYEAASMRGDAISGRFFRHFLPKQKNVLSENHQ
jgi:hypothetical protein